MSKNLDEMTRSERRLMAREGIVFNKEESKTQQHMADAVDINTIVKKHRRTGMVDPAVISQKMMRSGDFRGAPSFFEASLKMTETQQLFLELDPRIRERFRNDPGEMIDFLGDEKNREEAEKMGLLTPKGAPGDVDAGQQVQPDGKQSKDA